MNKIKKYNKIIEEIVFDFVKRLYIEDKIGETPDERDFDIVNYKGVIVLHIDIWDRCLSLEDILLCESEKFQTKTVIDYYDLCYDLHMEDKKPTVNYYNYAKYGIKV